MTKLNEESPPMSARPAGSFATLLMSGPLIAIPLMAIFGVPQFTPVSEFLDRGANTEQTDQAAAVVSDEVITENVDAAGELVPLERSPRVPREQLPREERWTPQPPLRESESQDFAVATSSDASAEPLPTDFFADASANTRDSQETEDDSQFEQVIGQSVPIDPKPVVNVPSAESTWKTAAERLRELGINDYRLERGQRPGTSLFICQFATDADARIVRRFEAEGASPVEAVQNVLNQIDHWKRHADSSLVNAP